MFTTKRNFLEAVIKLAQGMANEINAFTTHTTNTPDANGNEKTVETQLFTAEDLQDFALKELTLLDAKNKKRRETLTKTQQENLTLQERILALFNDDAETVLTASSVAESFGNGFTTQKTSALLRALANDGKLEVIDGYKTAKGKVKGYKLIAQTE